MRTTLDLSGLKDQLRDQFETLWTRIQESSVYLNLKEQYDALPQLGQRALAVGAALLALGLILLLPYSYIQSAQEAEAEFNETRALLRDLLHIARDAQLPPPLPPGTSSAQLQSQVQSTLGPFTLLPEQMGPIQALGPSPAGSLVAKRIEQAGVSVQLNKLNLRQILDIGSALQRINPGVRLMGLEIQNNREDNRYYDVQFQLVNFSLPGALPSSDEES